ncbi:glycosyl transferase family 1 [Burkholderia stagnalis]|uniref:Glycosyltransferase family 4 protein n=1 Tax=Burkholderia stagnalis TaxID=1503054 RepID=A0A6L3MPE1_9BURK|nr:glycosyltransferase family 4 protein [Burkholderia stagnalis]KVO44809.1 glycosyl transferase family 1 [Burkholderia stagnalis]KVO66455.1 glycosyl transferase family 1 [Burkholderia stagnalis]KVW54819.1 glycosyl transferase family 1 [Burkholderia stagnalis]KVW78578.1 glycosyl transferase family 1 [Burkholderia stagnalis]
MSTSIREREGAHDAYAPREVVASARTTHGRALAINGKFASQRMTGVQRVAYELTAELARIAGAADAPPVVVQPAHDPAALPAQARRQVAPGLRGVLWEQWTLPRATCGRTLLSLCNVGPLLKREQVLLIHDAAVFDLPAGYSLAFRVWYRLAFAILKRRARHIVTVSHFSRARIAARLRMPPARVSVVPGAVDHVDRIDADPRVLSRLRLERDGYVLFVGSLAPGKNLGRALEAIALLRRSHPAMRFVIAGSANAKIFGEAAGGPRADDPRVTWAGYVTDGELKALYEAAGCFVFPSLYEGFGLPPLEAMRSGCPVIVSHEGALPEVCGGAALFCDAYDAADIAATIARVMDDAALRERLRAQGVAHAGRFSWQASAQALLGVVRGSE